jgi:hypothetical protein
LRTWAARWHLADAWCLAYARATRREWCRYPTMKRTYWMYRDDVAGTLYCPRPGRQAPRPLKKPLHFEWMVRYQVRGESYLQVCKHARDWRDLDAADPSKPVRDACRSLAKLLGLALRSEKGWTRYNRQRKRAQ